MAIKQNRFKTAQLDVLRRLLDGLDDGLPRNCQGDGLGAELPESDELLVSARSFRHAMEELQTLKAARRALAVPFESLEARISRVQESLLPASLHHGILDLPDKPLLLIFNMSALRQKKEDEESYDLAFQFKFITRVILALSQTCRRFRDVTTSCPAFWAYERYPTLGRNTDHMRNRNKGIGLHVEIESMAFVGRSANNRLLDSIHDWCTLTICEQRSFFIQLPLIYCPKVECLGVYTDWHGHYDKASVLFYNGWSFPNLKHLLVKGRFAGITAMEALSHITEFTYIAEPHAQLRALLAALALMPHLQRLNIDLKKSLIEPEDRAPPDKALLPCLTSLRVNGIDDKDCDAEDELHALLAGLNTPKLKHIHLSFYRQDNPEGDDFAYNLLNQSACLDSVKHLSLEILSFHCPGEATTINIGEVLKLFTSLETLDLAVFGLDLHTSWKDAQWKEYSKLRSVNITQASPYRLPSWCEIRKALRLGEDEALVSANVFELSADSTADKLKRLFPETIKLVVK